MGSRKVPSSLLGLTYGALVAQLLRDHAGDAAKVNAKLDQVGESMGMRLVDEVLARGNVKRCGGVFKDAVALVAQIGFKFYWNLVPQIANWNADLTECVLVFPAGDNPLEEFVDLPDDLVGRLHYSQVLCGVVRGALQCVNIKTTCEIDSDRLWGDSATGVRIRLVEFAREIAGEDYQEE